MKWRVQQWIEENRKFCIGFGLGTVAFFTGYLMGRLDGLRDS